MSAKEALQFIRTNLEGDGFSASKRVHVALQAACDAIADELETADRLRRQSLETQEANNSTDNIEPVNWPRVNRVD